MGYRFAYSGKLSKESVILPLEKGLGGFSSAENQNCYPNREVPQDFIGSGSSLFYNARSCFPEGIVDGDNADVYMMILFQIQSQTFQRPLTRLCI
jgi:hypothetical protein